MIKKHYFVLFFICLQFSVLAQRQIKGSVKSHIDNSSIWGCSVMLREFQSKKILTYSRTNKNGDFFLKTPKQKGAYTIEVRHINYQTVFQNIIITETVNRDIDLIFKMNLKQNQLTEVVIEKNQPIIVKKDTTIYNIKKFLQETDETLEDVLRKMDGIKILADGEITVDGQRVKKVLIDGKEVSDVGAGIITKSIDPNSVKNIEVRFDEKNDKLKESLLDTDKYVVLDIKLKKGFGKKFFGKIRPTIGYQKDTKFGGYLNLFSIGEKYNVHLFTEHDNFGMQTIDLKNIKNVGGDAFKRKFEIPDYFRDIKNYQKVDQGRSFNKFDRSIVGLTSKVDITDNWDLFFGSYNSFDIKESMMKNEQFFDKTPVSIFKNNNELIQPFSKNKLELKYQGIDSKLNIDVNFEYGKPNQKLTNTISKNNRYYNFETQSENKGIYNHLLFEKKISSQFFWEIKGAYAYIYNVDKTKFKHNDISYAYNLEGLDRSSVISPIYDFLQTQTSIYNQLNTQTKLQYRSIIGEFNTAVLFEQIHLDFTSNATDKSNNRHLIPFSEQGNNYKYQNIKPYLNHKFSLGKISLTNEIGYSLIRYPKRNKIISDKIFDYYGKLHYNARDIFWNVSYSSRMPSFALTKTLQTHTLLDFQKVQTSAENITLQKQKQFDININKKFKSLKLGMTLFYKLSSAPSLNKYFLWGSSFINEQRAQLQMNRHLMGISLQKNFKYIIVNLTPSMSIFEDENETDTGKRYKTKTRVTEISTIIYNNNFKDVFYFFIIDTSYNKYIFSNTLLNTENTQEIIKFSFSTDFPIIDKMLFLDIKFKNRFFIEKEKSNFTNLDLGLKFKYENIDYFLNVSNVFNDTGNIQKNIYPNYFSIQTNEIFGRFIKIGVNYKFK